ncbi:hypothetical protein D3C78_1530430 [compost metagenome]
MRLVAAMPRKGFVVLAGGVRGPAGRDGAQGGEVATFIAGAVLSGHRALYSDGSVVRYASADDPSSAERCVGIGLQAAGPGGEVLVRRAGLLIEPTWAWTPGPVFLAAGGTMSQTPPDGGAVLQLGVALDTISLDVRIGTPILLD